MGIYDYIRRVELLQMLLKIEFNKMVNPTRKEKPQNK